MIHIHLLNLSPCLDSKGSMRSRDVSAFALVTSGDYGDREASAARCVDLNRQGVTKEEEEEEEEEERRCLVWTAVAMGTGAREDRLGAT